MDMVILVDNKRANEQDPVGRAPSHRFLHYKADPDKALEELRALVRPGAPRCPLATHSSCTSEERPQSRPWSGR